MRKFLQIKEIQNERGIVTHIQIVKQSHRGNKFSNDRSLTGDPIFIFQGFFLTSVGYPATISRTNINDDTRRRFHCEIGLFVRGCEEHRDDDILEIPSQEWLIPMRAAVEGYNKKFMTCNGCEVRHCNSCKK